MSETGVIALFGLLRPEVSSCLISAPAAMPFTVVLSPAFDAVSEPSISTSPPFIVMPPFVDVTEP